MHSFCIAFVLDKILTLGRKIHFLFARLIGFLHYLCTHEENIISTRIFRHRQLSDG